MLWFALGGLIVLSMLWVDHMLHPRHATPRHPVIDYSVCFLFGAIVFGSPMWILFSN